MNKVYRDKVRIICHSLRMASLTGVDPNRLIDLSSRIKSLPSPEKIASMEHGDLAELSTRVERLIFDIGNSKNARTVGYAIKHRIDKGIPPRLSPVLAGETWLDKAAAEMAQPAEPDYSRELHPEWVVAKTNQKVGPSRIFTLSFAGQPVLDFLLTRDANGKYDGDIKEIHHHPGMPWPRGVRAPMTCELYARATDLIDYMKDFQNVSEEEFHRVMKEGTPMPPNE